LVAVQRQAFADQGATTWSVLQLDIDGAIGPATSDYIRRNFDKALATGAKMIILRIETPADWTLRCVRLSKKSSLRPCRGRLCRAKWCQSCQRRNLYSLRLSCRCNGSGTNLGGNTGAID